MELEVVDTLRQAIAAIPSQTTEVARLLYQAHVALDVEVVKRQNQVQEELATTTEREEANAVEAARITKLTAPTRNPRKPRGSNSRGGSR